MIKKASVDVKIIAVIHKYKVLITISNTEKLNAKLANNNGTTDKLLFQTNYCQIY